MKRKSHRPPDDKRLRELILFICEQSEGDDAFGSAKLNKLLFIADFESYAATGTSITGHAYVAQSQGPCPAKLKTIVEKMRLRGDIAFQKRELHGHSYLKPVALRPADVNTFEPAEIVRIDRLVRKHWNRFAPNLIDESESLGAWTLARKGETIPYTVALLSNRELTPDEIRRGQKLEAVLKGR